MDQSYQIRPIELEVISDLPSFAVNNPIPLPLKLHQLANWCPGAHSIYPEIGELLIRLAEADGSLEQVDVVIGYKLSDASSGFCRVPFEIFGVNQVGGETQ